jgi:hypothetical protein
MTEDGDPEPAEGWFYLVRSAGECDLQGTYYQDLPPQAAPRDQGVAASGSDCP